MNFKDKTFGKNYHYGIKPLNVRVTGFAKRGHIYVSNFATLISHNFVCDIELLNCSYTLMIRRSSHKISKLYLNYKLSYISLKLKI